MGVPVRSNHVFIGSLLGKPNKKKLTRIYNEAFQQVSNLWKMLPESVRTSLKSETDQPENMEVEEPLTAKSKIKDLEDRVNSLKGKQTTYKEKMTKKKLKNQLKKKKKSQEKSLMKEEMRLKKKKIKEQKLAEKLKNGEVKDTNFEKKVKQVEAKKPPAVEEKEDDTTEEDVMSNIEDFEEENTKKLGLENTFVCKQTSIKDKLAKKKLKKQLKKKKKSEEKNNLKEEMKQKKKELKEQKLDEEMKSRGIMDLLEKKINEGKKATVQENNEEPNEVMFNKIDFEGEDAKKKFKKKVKPRAEKDPKRALNKIEELNKKITDLKEMGDDEKAAAIKNKESWKAAILKADGVRVKDNVKLLKKTIKKKEKQKSKSKTDWAKRKEVTEKKMADAQKKRKENIQKKKKEKKDKKIKKSIKKGRVVI